MIGRQCEFKIERRLWVDSQKNVVAVILGRHIQAMYVQVGCVRTLGIVTLVRQVGIRIGRQLIGQVDLHCLTWTHSPSRARCRAVIGAGKYLTLANRDGGQHKVQRVDQNAIACKDRWRLRNLLLLGKG